MNGHWKTIVTLICILSIVLVFAVMKQIENIELQNQIKDQNKLELDNGLKDVKIKELENPKTEEQRTETETVVDQTELLEFLSDYVSAQKHYIKTLQEVCKNNGVSYPIFIYAELENK